MSVYERGVASRVRILVTERLFVPEVTHDITAICGEVNMSAACNTSSGKVSFEMLNTPNCNFNLGDICTIEFCGRIVFRGRLVKIERSNDWFARTYQFNDESFYLKNQICYPVPTSIEGDSIVKGMLDKYEIGRGYIESTPKVRSRKIFNTSILDAIKSISDELLYFYEKYYVTRQNAGVVEFVDLESDAANTKTLANNALLKIIDYSASTSVEDGVNTYFEFYKNDDQKKSTTYNKKSDSKGNSTTATTTTTDTNGKPITTPQAPTTVTKTQKMIFEPPKVEYTRSRLDLAISCAHMRKSKSELRAYAEKQAEGKPTLYTDTTEVKKGYTLGSVGYKLLGEQFLWGYLPFIKQYEVLPPDSVRNKIIDTNRHPVRNATFTILLDDEFYIPGDKLIVGVDGYEPSEYAIESVETIFSHDCITQKLTAFTWQKVFDSVQETTVNTQAKSVKNTDVYKQTALHEMGSSLLVDVGLDKRGRAEYLKMADPEVAKDLAELKEYTMQTLKEISETITSVE